MSADDVPDLIEANEDAAGPSRTADIAKIPVTLLTGYLGAGKSTLVDYLLKADHGYRVAVCMNDFGDTTDIESRALTINDPVTGEQTSAFLTLPNGCLCCSFKDLGIAAVEEMVKRQPVDWVVVELTGLADPGPVAKSFWANEEMGELELDAVICVVDGRNVLRQIDEPTLQRQIALADLLLLNKTDLVPSPSDLASIEARVRAINPSAPLRRTERARIDLGALFRVGAYSGGCRRGVGVLGSSVPDLSDGHGHDSNHDNDDDDCHHDHGRGHDHDDDGHCLDDGHADGDSAHTHTPHYDGITTVTIPLPPLSTAQFDALIAFLQDTLWPRALAPSCVSNSDPDSSSNSDPNSKFTSNSTSDSTSNHKSDPDQTSDPESNPRPKPHPAAAAGYASAPEILRTKGLVTTETGAEWIVQGVADLFELTPAAALPSSASTTLPASATTTLPARATATALPLSAPATALPASTTGQINSAHQSSSDHAARVASGGKLVFIGRGVGEALRTACTHALGL